MNSININTRLSQELSARVQQIEAAVALLDEGATVPFIVRYRKEVTGGLYGRRLKLLDERLVYLRKLFLSTLTAILFMFTGTQVYAVDTNDKLENMLTEALKLNKEKTARMMDSHKVIKAYKNAGIINKKNDSNIDYQHSYIVKKPIKFMGHNLIVLQEEYMEEYVGCCVNDGIELLLKANGNTQNLQKFATTNECTFTQPVNIQEVIQEDDLPKLKPTAGNYVSLSCKANSIKKNTP